ncbi:Uncharacterized protein YjlB [Grifola frondosa]|uniref:Uncharacterized protein YjlB n=1 Tax=Grifola frondosa TaxID=5627 RepID=A0A1C7LYQ2_GRIFR|nr:Uncharacterized protein YjlB [Grifola frondosa]
MYPEEHFHSTAHEVLVVSSGRARVQFGGDDNPAAVTVEVACGDAMLVPAGVSHRMLEDIEGNFEMVGAYQLEAEHWDMCYGKPEEDELIVRIKDLPWFDRDPLYGDQGPAVAC